MNAIMILDIGVRFNGGRVPNAMGSQVRLGIISDVILVSNVVSIIHEIDIKF